MVDSYDSRHSVVASRKASGLHRFCSPKWHRQAERYASLIRKARETSLSGALPDELYGLANILGRMVNSDLESGVTESQITADARRILENNSKQAEVGGSA